MYEEKIYTLRLGVISELEEHQNKPIHFQERSIFDSSEEVEFYINEENEPVVNGKIVRWLDICTDDLIYLLKRYEDGE
jgi:hypothetical protein